MQDIPLDGCSNPGLLSWLAAVGAAVTLSDIRGRQTELYWIENVPILRRLGDRWSQLTPLELSDFLTDNLNRKDRAVWNSGRRRNLTQNIDEVIRQAVTDPNSRRTADLLGVLTAAAWPADVIQQRTSLWVGGSGQQDFWRKAKEWCRKANHEQIFSTLFGEWEWVDGAGIGWHPAEDAQYLGQHCPGAYRLALEGLRILPPVAMYWDDETGTQQVDLAGWRGLSFRYIQPTSPSSIDVLRSLMGRCRDDQYLHPDVQVYEVNLHRRQSNRRYMVVSPTARV